MHYPNLEQAMRISGHDVSWLAHHMGISRVTFWRKVRRGFRFSPEEEERLAALLKVDPAWLFAGSDSSVTGATVELEV